MRAKEKKMAFLPCCDAACEELEMRRKRRRRSSSGGAPGKEKRKISGDGSVRQGRRHSWALGLRADGAHNKRGRGGPEEVLAW
jgi:hypothetical protein